MAWGKQHKEKTRQKILDCAAPRFMHEGFDAVSIDAIMADAELTRGAFYAHFSSKKQLYAEAIKTAGMTSMEGLQQQADPEDMLHSLIAGYLSRKHCLNELPSCPLALLITDINHRDEVVRNAYTRTLQGFIGKIETHATTSKIEVDSETALQTAITMIGGLALARAINNEDLSEQILSASQNLSRKILQSDT